MLIRQSYRQNEFEEFKEKLEEYFKYGYEYKTMGGLCKHLGIERYTLSRYKKRGREWKKIISDARFFIIYIQPSNPGLRYDDFIF